jgi:hypothetical protein
MKIKKLINALGLALCLYAVGVSAQSVQSDFDRSSDLSKLRTFTFAGEVRNVNRQSSTDLMNDERIMTALDRKLTASGYVRQDDRMADFKVVYTVASRNRFALREYNYGPFRFGGRDINVDRYTEGSLIVDIIDTRTNQVIWRGHASGAVDLDSIDKKITKSVDKLVNQFVKDSRKREVK